MNIIKSFTYSGHDAPVYTLETGIESGTILSGGGDKVVAKWKLGSEIPEGIIQTQSTIYSIRSLVDKGLILVGVSAGGFHLIDPIRKKELRYIVHHEHGVFDIAYLPLRNRIITAGADGKMAVWTADEFELLHSFQLCKGKVRSLSLSSDMVHLAAACGDGMIRLFRTDDFTPTTILAAHAESANAVLFHPDGTHLITGGKDAYLRKWNYSDGKLADEIPAHNYAIYSIVLSPDKKWIATASRDKTIKLWNATDLSFVKRIDKLTTDGHIHSVNTLLWPEDDIMLSAGDDRKIMEWRGMKNI